MDYRDKKNAEYMRHTHAFFEQHRRECERAQRANRYQWQGFSDSDAGHMQVLAQELAGLGLQDLLQRCGPGSLGAGYSRLVLFAASEAIKTLDIVRAEQLCRVALVREAAFPFRQLSGEPLSPHEIFSRWDENGRQPVSEVQMQL